MAAPRSSLPVVSGAVKQGEARPGGLRGASTSGLCTCLLFPPSSPARVRHLGSNRQLHRGAEAEVALAALRLVVEMVLLLLPRDCSQARRGCDAQHLRAGGAMTGSCAASRCERSGERDLGLHLGCADPRLIELGEPEMAKDFEGVHVA